MNFKTTVVMMIVLAILLGWFLIERPDQKADADRSPVVRTTSSVAEKSIFENPPEVDDVSAVSVTRAGEDTWRFERAAAEDSQDDAGWQMMEPGRFDVQKWHVDSIVRTVTELKYHIKYAPGDTGAVTAAQAGLDPPRVEVVIEDREGASTVLQAGKPVPPNGTYVRVDGSDDIYVAQRSLEYLVKDSVNDYRDKSLVKFSAGDATGMTVLHRPEDGDPVRYRLAKLDGEDWAFQEPFAADADDSAIENAITAASRLRAGEWVEHRPQDGYGVFGLAAAKLEVEIVTEKTIIESEDDDDEEAEGDDTEQVSDQKDDAEQREETKHVETQRYAFMLSGRSPLGKDSVVYFKLADQEAVATISKTIADKFLPETDKWRNMDVVPTPVTNAEKVRIQIRDARSAVLVKNERKEWVFEDTGARGEKVAIDDLLKTIDDLKALNFVDGADPTEARFGLVDPRAQIVLILPGRDQPEKITVGNPTDDVAKRVYYVRRGESSSIAKVRADDVAVLERSPNDYLNREIVTMASSDLERIEITRPNAVTGETELIELVQTDGKWRLAKPVDAAADTAAALKLVTTIANLRAEQVVDQSGPESAYGLDQPTVKLTVTYKGPAVITADQDAAEPQPPASQSVELSMAEKDGKVYAKRADAPAIYRIRRRDFEPTQAEFHDKSVLTFEQSQVVSVSVTSGETTHRFEKRDEGWVYAAEPDLPIDPKKVTDLLLQINDLRLKRYVAYAVESLADYGLDKPAKTVKVGFEGQEAMALFVSERSCPGDSGRSVYAVIEGTADIFLLTPDTVSRLAVSLGDFEKAPGS
ncbi:MAG: DUF4340 domain-containing protein [Phycisphaerae bacterium]